MPVAIISNTYGMTGSGVTSVLDLVRFQFVPDGLDVQAKLPGCFRFVLACLLERFQNKFALGLCSRNPEGENNLCRRLDNGISEVRRQVENFNPLSLCKDQRAFHYIP